MRFGRFSTTLQTGIIGHGFQTLVTKQYRPPELLEVDLRTRPDLLTPALDYFAFGACVWELGTSFTHGEHRLLFRNIDVLRDYAASPVGEAGPWRARVNSCGIFSCVAEPLLHPDPKVRRKVDILRLPRLCCCDKQTPAELF